MKRNYFVGGRHLFILASLGVVLGTGPTVRAQEKLPPGAKVVRLEAYPETMSLATAFEFRQLLITAQLDSGDRVDVTRMSRFEMPSKLATVSPTGLVRPVA